MDVRLEMHKMLEVEHDSKSIFLYITCIQQLESLGYSQKYVKKLYKLRLKLCQAQVHLKLSLVFKVKIKLG